MTLGSKLILKAPVPLVAGFLSFLLFALLICGLTSVSRASGSGKGAIGAGGGGGGRAKGGGAGS